MTFVTLGCMSHSIYRMTSFIYQYLQTISLTAELASYKIANNELNGEQSNSKLNRMPPIADLPGVHRWGYVCRYAFRCISIIGT